MLKLVNPSFRASLLLCLIAPGCFVSINNFDPSPEGHGEGGSNNTLGDGGHSPEQDETSGGEGGVSATSTGGVSATSTGGDDPYPVSDSECGNGDIEEGEECDDENTVTESCKYSEMSCEVCGRTCKKVPGVLHYCGDGQLDNQEECDRGDNNGKGCTYGGTKSCTACDASCKEYGAEPRYCGDGVTDEADGEVCDEGDKNGSGPGTCDANCRAVQTCGDGITSGTEICDDGENNGKDNNCDLRCGLPWFVDTAAEEGGDGNSWATAFNKLATAVSAAQGQGGGELWVKAGEYEGDTYFRTPAPALALAANVRVYGGFDGSETLRAQRDWKENKTYLTRGSHNVELASHTVVDGFYITQADASDDYESAGGINFDARGGAIYGVNVTNVTLRNLIVSDNYAFLGGSAFYLKGSSAIIRNVLMDSNGVGPGGGNGGIIDGGNVEIFDSRFVNHGVALGAGALTVLDAVFRMEDSEFWDNTGSYSGPVYLSNLTGTTRITNCLFAHNWGPLDPDQEAANAIWVADDSKVIITHASFIQNNEDGMEPVQPDVRAGAGTEVHNAVNYHSWHDVDYVGVSAQNSCTISYGPSSKYPIAKDRNQDGFDELYLHPLGNCVDAGDNTEADLAGLSWRDLTTSETDCLDSGRVDAGVHYPPLSDNVGPCASN